MYSRLNQKKKLVFEENLQKGRGKIRTGNQRLYREIRVLSIHWRLLSGSGSGRNLGGSILQSSRKLICTKIRGRNYSTDPVAYNRHSRGFEDSRTWQCEGQCGRETPIISENGGRLGTLDPLSEISLGKNRSKKGDTE